jgi:hypothetical protein
MTDTDQTPNQDRTSLRLLYEQAVSLGIDADFQITGGMSPESRLVENLARRYRIIHPESARGLATPEEKFRASYRSRIAEFKQRIDKRRDQCRQPVLS